ncbi:MAG: DUF177 domain-containing protein [Pyrinomonadaceae bacterium]
MIINFSQHSEPEISFAYRYDPGDIDIEDEIAQITGPLEITGMARRSSIIAHVKGDLNGNIEIACNRCLQPTQFALNAAFDVDFVTLENYGSGNNETELNAVDLSLSVYDGDRIDLDEIVREQVLLNLPMHVLCQDDCAGLCEKCGTNKNTNSCSCHETEIDPRWSALKKIKDKN